MNKVAIIGSGITGSTLANSLEKSFNVTIFDKSRGVGGRLSTRRHDQFSFDHGAQFIKANTVSFSNLLKLAERENFVKEWEARFVEIDRLELVKKLHPDLNYKLLVGAPRMNMLSKFLIGNTKVILNCKISELIKKNNNWFLKDDISNKYGPFDWVFITTPVQQAELLLLKYPSLSKKIKNIKMQSSFALMLGFNNKIDLGFDFASVKNSFISNISLNSSKPERAYKNSTCIVIQTNPDTEYKKEISNDKMIEKIIEESSYISNFDLSIYCHKALHFWRYTNVKTAPNFKSIIDKKFKVVVCGDWMVGKNIESGYISAKDAIKHLT